MAANPQRTISLVKPSEQSGGGGVFLIVCCHRGSPKPSSDKSNQISSAQGSNYNSQDLGMFKTH